MSYYIREADLLEKKKYLGLEKLAEMQRCKIYAQENPNKFLISEPENFLFQGRNASESLPKVK